MANLPVGHKPVEVVPDVGCRAEVIANGGFVYYGRSHRLDKTSMLGTLEPDGRVVIDSSMWFMSGGDASIVVVQQRFCRRCGWVDE